MLLFFSNKLGFFLKTRMEIQCSDVAMENLNTNRLETTTQKILTSQIPRNGPKATHETM